MIGHESGAAFWIVFLSGGVVIELARLALRWLARACERIEASTRAEDIEEAPACPWCGRQPDVPSRWQDEAWDVYAVMGDGGGGASPDRG